MTDIEYSFGTGDGVVHDWSSAADLDLAGTGLFDAVRLDFDGDGLADDALWDSTGAGVADIAALDLDDDGVPDHFYTDPTGEGTWDHHVSGSPADAANEPLEWIVRTGPSSGAEVAPDAGSSPGATVACDIAFGRSAYAALPEAGEYSGRPGDQRVEQSATETGTDLPVTDETEPTR
ncbi:hypothetical protein [Nocardia shimofusensis]|uniref:hypothetical protein n=1 Tax=Nocardia shimofusensis TaxID=228596 RepID=UPI00082EE016|nr:hypothetical protein [Nocardia shimofusensis]